MSVFFGLFLSFSVSGLESIGGGALILSVGLVMVDFMVSGLSMAFCSKTFLGNMNIDSMSFIMVSMSLLVGMLSLVCSQKDISCKTSMEKGSMEVAIMAVIVVCVGFFCCSRWMPFFFMFELSLVPTLWLIINWGYQPERLQAGVFMMMYTVCASLPLMVCLLWMSKMFMSDVFCLVKLLNSCFIKSLSINSFIWCGLIFSFLVKLPVFIFHSWLPKAHVEAPLSGSMILAGILLKLGGFGLCRVLSVVGPGSSGLMSFILISSLWGGVLCSCICLCQCDIKALIAYSSVGHMSICLCGILSFYWVGWSGAVCMMFAHGLCSPIMFSLAAVCYDWTNSRSLLINKGALALFPAFSCFWCVFSMLNMGFPPSLNFFSEWMLICSAKGVSKVFMVIMGLMCFVTGAYCFYMYSTICHGAASKYLAIMNMGERFMYGSFLCGVILSVGFFGLDYVLL